MANEKRLMPCPWCKTKAKKLIIGKNFGHEYRVEHFCVFTILGRKWHRTEDAAIAEWNARVDNEK